MPQKWGISTCKIQSFLHCILNSSGIEFVPGQRVTRKHRKKQERGCMAIRNGCEMERCRRPYHEKSPLQRSSHRKPHSKESYKTDKDEWFNFQLFPTLLVVFFCLSFATCADTVGCKDILPDDFPDVCISDYDSLDKSERHDNSMAPVFSSLLSEVPLSSNIPSARHFVNLLPSQRPPSEEALFLCVLLC